MPPSKREWVDPEGNDNQKRSRLSPKVTHWTVSDNEDGDDVSRESLLGEGGYGEVHKV